MTVIIKDIPDMTAVEILDALHDINSSQPVRTGHGGFVVDEETALEFLSAYLRATGRLAPAMPAPAPAPEPVVVAESVLVEEYELPKRRTTRKGARS